MHSPCKLGRMETRQKTVDEGFQPFVRPTFQERTFPQTARKNFNILFGRFKVDIRTTVFMGDRQNIRQFLFQKRGFILVLCPPKLRNGFLKFFFINRFDFNGNGLSLL